MADRTAQPKIVSPSREALRRYMAGTTGILRGMKEGTDPEHPDGADLPPGSMAFPPCQCPQHRERPERAAGVRDLILSLTDDEAERLEQLVRSGRMPGVTAPPPAE